MIEVGDQVIISKKPASKATLDGHGNELAVVLKVDGGIAEVQLSRSGWKRKVLLKDLLPSGQLKLWR